MSQPEGVEYKNFYNLKVKISAIVTCHNYGRFLARCLDSLLAQGLPFHEIILVDDRSTDNTVAVASAYQGKVKYLRSEAGNVCRARQLGFQESQGDFVVTVDADDWMCPDYNQKLIQPFLQDASVGIAYCGYSYYFETEKDRKNWPDQHFRLHQYDRDKLRRFNYIPQMSMLRREAWLGQDPELPNRLEDWEHYLRITENGWKAVLVPEYLYFYRVHSTQSTRHLLDQGILPHNYEVMRRHLSEELTVLVLFAGKAGITDSFLENLAALRKPARTQYLFIDNSGNPDFNQRLRKFNPKTVIYDRQIKFDPAQAPYIPVRYKIAEQVAKLYEFAKPYIQGKKILVVEDDVYPKPEQYFKLEESRERCRADLMSGTVLSRSTGDFLAWRAHWGDPEKNIYTVYVANARKRVLATGFGFLLLDSALYWQIPFCSSMEGMPMNGHDLMAGIWAHRNNKRWFIDGSIRCEHRDPEGKPAVFGHWRNSVCGAHANLSKAMEFDA